MVKYYSTVISYQAFIAKYLHVIDLILHGLILHDLILHEVLSKKVVFKNQNF